MGNLATNASLTIEVKITKKMYGWSKYGGARKGLVKEMLDQWNCQCCGELQTSGLSAYMYEIFPLEYVRLCSKCWNMHVRTKFNFDALKLIFRRGMWVENLLDLDLT